MEPYDGDVTTVADLSSQFYGLPDSDESRKPYARLDPILPELDPIDLCEPTFSCGRGGNAEFPIDVNYNFSRLKSNNNIYSILSKKHFTINRVNDESTITDLSTNGTFINHSLIGRYKTIELNDGDVISMGKAHLLCYIYHEGSKSTYPKSLTDKYIMTNKALGKGGYGKVMLAKLRLNCREKYAVKILETSRLSSRFSRTLAKREDIKNEVDIMLQLKHPNCLQFIDWIENDSTAYIVLEYVGGGELFDRIVDPRHNGMGFGEELGKFYAYQLLSAVAYIHDCGITHRDIKPENILCLTKDNYTIVKLSDFGLAKPRSRSTMRTFCGTPSYIAPEMIDNDMTAYDPKVDLWSVGVVLFTGIVGYPPFSQDYDDMDLNEQIRTGRLIFHKQWKFVTLETQTVIRNLLKVDPCLRLSARDALGKKWMFCPIVDKAHAMVERYRSNAVLFRGDVSEEL